MEAECNSAGRTDPEVSTSYLADNLNLSACFRRRRPESERDRSYRPLACVPEINGQCAHRRNQGRI